MDIERIRFAGITRILQRILDDFTKQELKKSILLLRTRFA